MEIAAEDLSTQSESGVTPNPKPPVTATEEKAVECFKALEDAEQDFQPGLEFGNALIALRAEIKANRSGKWMERLKELGITYEKARYWMAVAEGKPTQRGNSGETKKAGKEHLFDWEDALAKLKPLVDDIDLLRRSKPDGANILKGELEKLAEIVGCGLVEKARAGA